VRDTVFLAAFLTIIGIGIYFYQNTTKPYLTTQTTEKTPIEAKNKTNKFIDNRLKPKSTSVQSKKIYSIYPNSSKEEIEEVNEEETKSAHGVPFIKLAKLLRNSIHREPPKTNGAFLRIFVQCMEIEKFGPRYLNQKECKELAEKMVSFDKRTK